MNFRIVPTKTHGVLDYPSVVTLLTAPRALGWGPCPTTLLPGAAAAPSSIAF